MKLKGARGPRCHGHGVDVVGRAWLRVRWPRDVPAPAAVLQASGRAWATTRIPTAERSWSAHVVLGVRGRVQRKPRAAAARSSQRRSDPAAPSGEGQGWRAAALGRPAGGRNRRAHERGRS